MRLSRSGARVVLALFLTLFILAGSDPPSLAKTSDEYQLKAAFLYHFAHFVRWPRDVAFAGSRSLTICVVGSDRLSAGLSDALRGRQVQGRSIGVSRVSAVRDLGGCHMLFIGPGKGKWVGRIQSVLEGKPILTVAEFGEFLNNGGMVRLYLDRNRVRFEVNPQAVARANLKISSKVLRLARAGGN